MSEIQKKLLIIDDDRLLPDEIGEILWPPLAGEYEIVHLGFSGRLPPTLAADGIPSV